MAIIWVHGSVITFFVLPLLGHRTDGNHFINGIRLAIPTGSKFSGKIGFLTRSVTVTETDGNLTFDDPDQIPVTMVGNWSSTHWVANCAQ